MLGLQHFYLQEMDRATFYKFKAFYGDMEPSNSMSKKQAILNRIKFKKRVYGDRTSLKSQR